MRRFFLMRLSDTEQQIMDVLWMAGRSISTREVMELLPDPKPSYNTVATHLTRLSHKNFVEHSKRSGDKTLYYSPLMSRGRYQLRTFTSIALLTVLCLGAVAGIVMHIPVLRQLWQGSEEPPQRMGKQHKAPADSVTAISEDTVQVVPERTFVPDMQPEYEGGTEAIQEFFDAWHTTDEEGRVYLSLLIDEKGNIREAHAVRDASTSPSLADDAEAVALTMPRWKPATHNGKPSSAWVRIAVLYLNE